MNRTDDYFEDSGISVKYYKKNKRSLSSNDVANLRTQIYQICQDSEVE